MEDQRLKIALAQADLVWEDVAANCRNFEKLFQDVDSDTDLLVLPEMFSTGFSMQVEKLAEAMNGPAVNWLKQQARAMNLVVAGSLMIAEAHCYYNRFVFAFPDGHVEHYDKRHLFSMGQENAHFTKGTARKLIQVKGFRLLPQVCYDLRFPVFARNLQDYDIYLNCANWPAPRKEVWTCLLKARAIENQAFVAGVNRTGRDAQGIRYSGDSVVFDARGTVLAESKDSSGNQVISAVLSKNSLEQFRKKFPVLPDSDSFSIDF